MLSAVLDGINCIYSRAGGRYKTLDHRKQTINRLQISHATTLLNLENSEGIGVGLSPPGPLSSACFVLDGCSAQKYPGANKIHIIKTKVGNFYRHLVSWYQTFFSERVPGARCCISIGAYAPLAPTLLPPPPRLLEQRCVLRCVLWHSKDQWQASILVMILLH